MSILSKKDVFFHFGAGLDKENLARRYKEINNWERPFFYRPSICPQDLSLMQGPWFYVQDSEDFPLEKVCFEGIFVIFTFIASTL